MSYECVCDYEMPSVFKVETYKASKQHKCSECGRRIERDERYEYVWGIWDGDASTFKVCCHCVALRDYVKAHVPCFCWAYGNIRDEALDMLREYAHEAPGLFFGGARHYVKALKIRRQQMKASHD